MLELVIMSFVAFFVTIDPLGVVPIFVVLTADTDEGYRRKMATKGVIIATVIMLVFALMGSILLNLLGISLNAFRISGGILLLLLAIDMIFVKPSGLSSATGAEREEALKRHDISVFPLAIPLLSGPGALTSILLFMEQTEGNIRKQAVIVAVLVAVSFITWIGLLCGNRLSKVMGVTGINVASRIMGIILAALACQFLIDGLNTVFRF